MLDGSLENQGMESKEDGEYMSISKQYSLTKPLIPCKI